LVHLQTSPRPFLPFSLLASLRVFPLFSRH
jgi:hypothetical protein